MQISLLGSNMRLVGVVASLSVAVSIVWAANLHEKCQSSGECKAEMSFCRIASPSCGGGVCTCIPGFVEHENGHCRRKVKIGSRCSSNDKCAAANSECNGGTCQCIDGYKVGLKGDDCVSNLKTERYNGKCYDSVQCHYNMVCLLNQCTCYTGYKVVGDYKCVERAVGDSCHSDSDCSRTPNTICSGASGANSKDEVYGTKSGVEGRCACQSGYKQVKYMVSSTEKAYACIPASEDQKIEGKPCNTTVTSSGTSLCKIPFVCTECDAAVSICTRPVLRYGSF